MVVQNDQNATELMERLLKETDRLANEVQRLWSRIEPFEDQPNGSRDIPIDRYDLQRIQTNDDVRRALIIMRRKIEGAEYNLSAIRGRVDEIAGDAILRDELKPWIKPSGGRRRD